MQRSGTNGCAVTSERSSAANKSTSVGKNWTSISAGSLRTPPMKLSGLTDDGREKTLEELPVIDGERESTKNNMGISAACIVC